MNKVKVPIIDNPELLDSIISNIQKGLAENIGWLDYVFGRAERLVKFDTNNRKIYTPNVYVGGNEYMEISPSSDIGNFCFFWVDDPQNVSWEAKINVGIKTNFSLIFWFNFNRIYNSADQRNKEELKKQILDVLNGGFWLKKGRITVNRIYELSENIFRGFSLDETENQFLMQPYGGFRFEGMLEVSESCGMVIPSGIVFNPIFEEEGINSYNFTINGKEAVKGNSYPLGSNVVFDIYPVEGKEVENISVNGKVYEGDVIENGKRFVFTLLESPQNIVVNLVNALVEVVASGEKFVVWNTIEGNNIKSFEIHGKTIQEGKATPFNPINPISVGESPINLCFGEIEDAINKKIELNTGLLCSVFGHYDSVKFYDNKWKKTTRINISRGFKVGHFSNRESNGDLRSVRVNGTPLGNKANSSISNFICNKFYYTGDSTLNKWNNVYGVWTNSILYGFFIVYDIKDYPTEDDLKAMIEDESTIFYYVVETPETKELDLNKDFETYKDQTWIMTADSLAPKLSCNCLVLEVLDYIKEGLLAYYTGRGRTNNDENKEILPDMSGNGNDLENKNFTYTIDSGFGDGYVQYDGIDDYSNVSWKDVNIRSVNVVLKNIEVTKIAPYSSVSFMVGNNRSLEGVISNGKITANNDYGYYNGNNLGDELYTKDFAAEKGILNIYIGSNSGLVDNPEYVYNLCLSAGNYYEKPNRYACKQALYDYLLYSRKLSEEEIEQNYKASLQFNGKLL
jgi:hypothetical protein